MMNTVLVILAFWAAFLTAIYVFAFWQGPPCTPHTILHSQSEDDNNTLIIYEVNNTDGGFDAVNSTGTSDGVEVQIVLQDNENNKNVDVENMAWFRRYPEFYERRNLSTLLVMHVIMRHGDRTNLKECQYPNDPYLNQTYEPVGFGELTNLGKRRMYEVGRALRHLYDDFLGEYHAEFLDAISSELNRAKVSLSLMLAGLYPPEEDLVWMQGADWQPIPFRSMMGKDILLGNPRHHCTYWAKYFDDAMQHFTETMSNYSEYFERLENFTGWEPSLLTADLLYNNIVTNLEWGLELDEQLEEFWPEPTDTLNKLFWKAWAETDNTKKAVAGLLLQKILEDSTSVLMRVSKRKLHVYSCSDYNIVSMLRVLGQDIYDTPAYGSHIITELHMNAVDKFYFKFFYRASFESPLLELTVTDCRNSKQAADDDRCMFEDFVMSRLKYFQSADFC